MDVIRRNVGIYTQDHFKAVFKEGANYTIEDEFRVQWWKTAYSNAITFGNNAFWGATALEEIVLPSVISFWNNAFNNVGCVCKLDLPQVKSMGNLAFMNAKIGIIELPVIEDLK